MERENQTRVAVSRAAVPFVPLARVIFVRPAGKNFVSFDVFFSRPVLSVEKIAAHCTEGVFFHRSVFRGVFLADVTLVMNHAGSFVNQSD